MLVYISKSIIVILLAYCSIMSVHAEKIKVGGFPFPPFVEKVDGEYKGVTLDLINVMNSFQDKYQFEFVATSARRRYQRFQDKKFDMIMFEDMSWGWQEIAVVPSREYFYGGEVYIAKADKAKDQNYFDSFDGKSIALINGYHYGFANFNSDPGFLRSKFDVQISSSFDGNVRKVALGRTDLAVVTLSYLKKMMKADPELEKALLVSDKFDQKYRHTMLLRKEGIGLTVDELNKMIVAMDKAGVLDNLWEKYGILDLKKPFL